MINTQQEFIDPQSIDDLPLFFCQKHPKFQLNMICADPKCSKKGLICCRCLTKDHLVDHQITSILNLEEVLEMCLQKVDASEGNQDFKKLDNINDDIIEQLQFLGSEILKIAQNLQKEVSNNRKAIKMEAQNHMGTIKCLLDLLQSKKVDPQKFNVLISDVSELVLANSQKRSLQIESLDRFINVNEEVLSTKREILNERVKKIVDMAQGIKIFDSIDPQLFKIQIYKDLDMQNLLDYGWKVVYDHEFFHKTTSKELDEIKNSCFQHSLVCVGAIQKSKADKLCLCAIDTAKEVFQETHSCKEARKSENGEIFWYFCQKISFGFAPVAEINLNDGDYNTTGNRLCWKLNGDGGYRVGDAIDLYNKHCNFKKIMLILK